MSLKLVEGRVMKSKTVRKNGVEYGFESMTGGTGEIGEYHDDGLKKREYGFTSGRTVQLHRYEFAKFRLGLTVKAGDEIADRVIRQSLEDVVLEFIHAEEEHIAGHVDYKLNLKSESVALINQLTERFLSIVYTLTLQRGKSESESVDVAEGIPVSDGVDIVPEIQKLSEQVTSWMDERYASIKGKELGSGKK